MNILSTFYAVAAATAFVILYVRTYAKYFGYQKHYPLGIILLLISIYIQFLLGALVNINIGFIALLSFVTYPISIHLIYKTNIFNTLFLSLNAIVKIYIMFLFFATLYASSVDIAYDPLWIKDTYYYNLSQGHAYLISIGSLFLADILLLRNKLKDFFLLKRNLLLLITIQIILIINVAWLSFTNITIDIVWYNSMLLITSFSFEIIYFLLRLFTANSSYFSSYKVHTETLRKQLASQIDHYKSYEEQMIGFAKFKHDYNKILNSISSLLAIKNYDAVEDILKDLNTDLDHLMQGHKNYSNNLILDALLNDYAKRFKRIDTHFEASTYIKIGNMTELKLIKLFYNILENAYEALLKVDPKNRLMKINSEIINSYAKISFVNTTVDTNNLTNKTSKKDIINHGFGLSIIRDILEEYDGFSNNFLTITDDGTYYNLEIFLPIEDLSDRQP